MTIGIFIKMGAEKMSSLHSIMSDGMLLHILKTKERRRQYCLRANLSLVVNFLKENRKKYLKAIGVENLMIKIVKLAVPAKRVSIYPKACLG